MPRARRNDPAGVCDDPVVVTDPARLDILLAEFMARLEYIVSNYRFWQESLENNGDFNNSLDRLDRALKRKRLARKGLSRLHPEVELLVTSHAQEAARLRTGLPDAEFEYADIRAGAQRVIATVKPRRGRPAAAVLRYHVEGLMALVQEMSGKPVLAGKSRNSEYHPHIHDDVSQSIQMVFENQAAGITEAVLTRMVRDARRKHAGKPMRFRDYFPLYGATVDPVSGMPRPAAGLRFERFGVSPPIYCP